MKIVGPIDAAWVLIESAHNRMHVGCVQIFSLPEGARRDYVRRLVAGLRRPRPLASPYSHKLSSWALHAVLPAWVEDSQVDFDYHVQHARLPAPGGEAELNALLAELHATSLDMTRPLWECHVIEGLERNRFALFMKIHHSLMDGVAGMRLLRDGLSADPQRRRMPAPWSQRRKPASHHHGAGNGAADHAHGGLHQVLRFVFDQFKNTPSLYHALSAFVQAARHRSDSALSAPYVAPQTPLNGRITTGRSFAFQQLPLQRVQEVAHRAGVTINDVVLAVCGGALRRYLQEREALPRQPLIAGIPVSVRPEGDTTAGTAVSFLLASMATDEADPLQRLRQIHRSTIAAKQQLHSLRREAITEYTLLLMAPYAVELLTGLAGHGHPVFNVVVSNVTGPAQALYFNGAPMSAMFPVSVLTHGQALNITILSYAGQLNIGFTACSQAVPDAHRLAAFTREAFEQIEAAVPPDASAGASEEPPAARPAPRRIRQVADSVAPV